MASFSCFENENAVLVHGNDLPDQSVLIQTKGSETLLRLGFCMTSPLRHLPTGGNILFTFFPVSTH